MTDLHIPPAALTELMDVITTAAGDGSWGDPRGPEAAVRRIATPVVTEVLRAIGDGLSRESWTHQATVDAVISALWRRADELDGGA